ncbi:hypothetical protein U1839_23265 [Sphingomonas sp. RT2P30]|uniref:hypothetical protein n=1 Tax=Parasphingomonas halimpatiens TaxID=3096162 RepID=UPI002FC87000
MYMAPIVRSKAPVSIMRRRLSGGVVMPLAVLFMLPWLALYALYAGTVMAIRGVSRAPRALLQMIDYAGTAVLGD